MRASVPTACPSCLIIVIGADDGRLGVRCVTVHLAWLQRSRVAFGGGRRRRDFNQRSEEGWSFPCYGTIGIPKFPTDADVEAVDLLLSGVFQPGHMPS